MGCITSFSHFIAKCRFLPASGLSYRNANQPSPRVAIAVLSALS